MNASPKPVTDGASAAAPLRRWRPMREDDVAQVMRIERSAYPYPWTEGIFRDCLAAGYQARVLLDEAGTIIGYAVLSVAAGEAHLLNICTAPAVQGKGHGRWLLRQMLALAGRCRAQRVFLEVRPSNPHAQRMYESEGFNEIGRRPRYYPADDGREDAVVMAMELVGGD